MILLLEVFWRKTLFFQISIVIEFFEEFLKNALLLPNDIRNRQAIKKDCIFFRDTLSNPIYQRICRICKEYWQIQYKSHVGQTRSCAGTRLDQPILQTNIGVGFVTLFLRQRNSSNHRFRHAVNRMGAGLIRVVETVPNFSRQVDTTDTVIPCSL